MPINQDSPNLSTFNIKPAKKLRMGHGWQWVNEGFRYFTHCKYNWMSTMFTLAFSVMLLVYFAPIFQLILIVILPLVTAGLALACYEIEQGQKMNVSYLIKGFVHKSNANLIRYGFWLILLMMIAQMIGSLLLGLYGIPQEKIADELVRLSNNSNPSFQAIMASPILVKYFAISFIMILPITAINIFSPYLLVFSGMTALQAIKYSAVAVIRNILPLMVYGLVYLALIFVTFMLLKGLNILLFFVFSEGSVIASMIYLIMMLMGFMIIAALSYCSAYVAFKDMFLGEEI